MTWLVQTLTHYFPENFILENLALDDHLVVGCRVSWASVINRQSPNQKVEYQHDIVTLDRSFLVLRSRLSKVIAFLLKSIVNTLGQIDQRLQVFRPLTLLLTCSWRRNSFENPRRSDEDVDDETKDIKVMSEPKTVPFTINEYWLKKSLLSLLFDVFPQLLDFYVEIIRRGHAVSNGS